MGSLTFSSRVIEDLRKDIARVVGMHDRDTEVDAAQALELALEWLQEYRWEELLYRDSFTTVAGQADYTLQSGDMDLADFETPYSVRITSANERKLTYISEDLYDRIRWDESSNGLFAHYTLTKRGRGLVNATEDPKITLLPTPDDVETVEIIAYNRVQTVSDGNPIVMPKSWELPLTLKAQSLVGLWRGLRSERVQQLTILAEDARRGALSRSREIYDEEKRLIPMAEHNAATWPWDHPLAGGGDW